MWLVIILKLIANRWAWELVQERLEGVPPKYEAQQGGFHGKPVSGNQPCLRPPTSTVTLKKLQWKYLPNTIYLPETDFQHGREGQGRKLLAKHCSNTAMIVKLFQMANTADSSAHGEVNPCGHPACIFVRKTAGQVDSRLTLPLSHLATFCT